MKKEKQNKEEKMKNKMEEIKIEKIVLSIGATAENLEKGFKLLSRLTGKKVQKMKSTKRIPSLGVRPGLEVGCMVTLRKKEAIVLLKRLLAAVNDTLKAKQISENSFSFGIGEYIEIPGVEYQRDIGMMGLEVSVAFTRPGKRVTRKKIKQGRLPKKQQVPKEEIIEFIEKNLGVDVK